MPNFPDFGKISFASKMLIPSVFISLLTTLDTTVLAQPATAPQPTPSSQPTSDPTKPATAPQPTPSPSNQSPNPASQTTAQKLLGQWKAENADAPITLAFIFSPEGKLFIFSPNSESAVAVEFKYRINPTPQPMHLDITVPGKKEPVLTIFDFTADGRLRLQLDNTDPGKPRPTAFSKSPALFTKVSDATKLPANIKLIDPQARDRKSN